MTRNRYPFIKVCAIATTLTMASLTVNASPEEYYGDARRYVEQGEWQAAVIQLKNALKENSDHVASRLLLGDIYLRTGDVVSAEKEFKVAAKLGAGRDDWVAGLGQALLAQGGRSEEILQRLQVQDEDSPKLQATIQGIRGQAYLQEGRSLDAQAELESALQVDSGNQEALLGIGYLSIANRDYQAAEKHAANLSKLYPRYIPGLLLNAELARIKNDAELALGWLKKAEVVQPDNQRVQLALATTLLAKGDIEGAKPLVGSLASRMPKHPLVTHLEALVAYQQGEIDKAESLLENTLAKIPDHAAAQLLMGTIKYKKGVLNQASEYLGSYLTRQPGNLQARRMLGAVYLNMGDATAAIETLEPGIDQSWDDAGYLAISGAAMLRNGKQERGLELIKRAVELEPDLGELRAQLAVGEIVAGNQDDAVAALQDIVGSAPEKISYDVLIVLAYMHANDFPAALEAARAMARRHPESPLADNLIGGSYLRMEKLDKARQAFQEAVQKEPGFIAAHINLARIDLLEKNLSAARERLEKLATENSDNSSVLMELASVAEMLGDADAARNRLEQARSAEPENLQPALTLAAFSMRHSQPDYALTVLNSIKPVHGDNPAFLSALGNAQLAAGNLANAETTAQLLIERAPEFSGGQLLLGRVLIQKKDFEDARGAYEAALRINPDETEAEVALVRIALQQQRFDAADELAHNLEQKPYGKSLGAELLGDVAVAKNDLKAAADWYAKSIQLSSERNRILKYYQVLRKLGRNEVAFEELEQWLASAPADASSWFLLANGYQSVGQDADAIKAYEETIKAAPDNVAALNNLAWLLQNTDLPKAISLAGKAHDIAPERPEITDTYAWLLLQDNKAEEALRLLRHAASLMPHMPSIRYHLAVALRETGKTDEARLELNRLLEDHRSFPERDAAMKLQGELKN